MVKYKSSGSLVVIMTLLLLLKWGWDKYTQIQQVIGKNLDFFCKIYLQF